MKRAPDPELLLPVMRVTGCADRICRGHRLVSLFTGPAGAKSVQQFHACDLCQKYFSTNWPFICNYFPFLWHYDFFVCFLCLYVHIYHAVSSLQFFFNIVFDDQNWFATWWTLELWMNLLRGHFSCWYFFLFNFMLKNIIDASILLLAQLILFTWCWNLSK